jgi:hypothetical protein
MRKAALALAVEPELAALGDEPQAPERDRPARNAGAASRAAFA